MKSSSKHTSSHILLFWSLPSISMIEDYKEKCKKLNEAIKKMKPIEVLTSQNKMLQLNKIGINSGRFYGFENFKGTMKKVLLNVNEIKMIMLLKSNNEKQHYENN